MSFFQKTKNDSNLARDNGKKEGTFKDQARFAMEELGITPRELGYEKRRAMLEKLLALAEKMAV